MAGLIPTSIRVKHVLDALPRPLSGLCYPCESLDPEVRIPGSHCHSERSEESIL